MPCAERPAGSASRGMRPSGRVSFPAPESSQSRRGGGEGLPTDAPGAPTPVPAMPGTAPTARTSRSWRSRIPEETGVIVALVALIAFIGWRNELFLQPKSLLQLVTNSAFFGMLAVGMVFVIVIRDIDL